MTEIDRIEIPPCSTANIDSIVLLFKSSCEYIHKDPNASLNKARQLAESICKSIFRQNIGVPSSSIMLDKLIEQLGKENLLPNKILAPLRTIQNYGSFGSHFQEDTQSISDTYAQPCLLALVQVMEWYFTEYLNTEIPNELSTFDVCQYIIPRRQIEQGQPDRPEQFSDSIKDVFFEINRTIDTLTAEQFSVIQTLKGAKRCLISGCAGSGKTLIAAEKSIRLDRAGLNTLVLCHNPILASYIRKLVKNSGVIVHSFSEWLSQLTQKRSSFNDTWTHYHEPTEEELSSALDSLLQSQIKYDAIIVDEGQDFRDTWWDIIEIALESATSSTLYIFYDENQALLKHRCKYPIEKPPLVLSRNCRNAGEIFDKVRKILPQAPETSGFLTGKGHFTLTEISKETLDVELVSAVKNALKYVSASDLVILTSEPDPIDNSLIANKIITVNDGPWQALINNYAYPKHILKNDCNHQSSNKLHLSDSCFPTETDIEEIRKHFRQLFFRAISASGSQASTLKSMLKKTGIKIVLNDGKPNIKCALNNFHIYDYLSRSQWVKDLESAMLFKTIGQQNYSQVTNPIRSFTISSYKGLESDAVILLMPPSVPFINKHDVYVAISRPKIYLHVLACKQVIQDYAHVFSC
jgi:adenylylsulfate kinase-like enzyme